VASLGQNQKCRTVARGSNGASSQGGFSLLELVFTLAIILVLTTLMWSHSSGNYQRAKKQLCQDNLQKCYMTLQIFANDHAGQLPDAPGAQTSEAPLSQLVPRYTADTTIFICPGSKDAPLPSGETFEKRRISYAYYMGQRLGDAHDALMSDRQVDTQPKAAGELIFSETGKPPGSNHNKFGGNIIFADGHAESSPSASAFSLSLTNGVVLLNPKP
jgi:prepilin-type N-terminal cleavage/methylation domain-containing protein/prepilin-type processing-associated H-X9-DG protein